MPTRPAKQKSGDRIAIISAVKTYLGFFVLLVLVVESVLGALALKTEGQNQLVALYGMLFVILTLIAVVSFFAYKKPERLLNAATAGAFPEIEALQDFCNRVSGHWWQRIKPDDASAISFVEIHPDRAASTVKMTGTSYNRDKHDPEATWESVASCVHPGERKIFYYWKGRHLSRPNEPYEGYGEISFQEFSTRIDRGSGIFSATNLTDMKSTRQKSIELRRCAPADVQAIEQGDAQSLSALARKKLE